MADDLPFYAPNQPPRPTRQPTPGELLFEFRRESDHALWRCELRDHGEHGVEAQFFTDGELLMSRNFHPRLDPTRTPRAMAMAWARVEQASRAERAACLRRVRSAR